MSNPLVKSGRLAWPAVIAVAFASVAIILFDLIWRTVSMSFESLALAFAVVLVAGAVLLFIAARLQRRRRRNV
jgi:ABC-type phosphate transport system permease subunit